MENGLHGSFLPQVVGSLADDIISIPRRQLGQHVRDLTGVCGSFGQRKMNSLVTALRVSEVFDKIRSRTATGTRTGYLFHTAA